MRTSHFSERHSQPLLRLWHRHSGKKCFLLNPLPLLVQTGSENALPFFTLPFIECFISSNQIPRQWFSSFTGMCFFFYSYLTSRHYGAPTRVDTKICWVVRVQRQSAPALGEGARFLMERKTHVSVWRGWQRSP